MQQVAKVLRSALLLGLGFSFSGFGCDSASTATPDDTTHVSSRKVSGEQVTFRLLEDGTDSGVAMVVSKDGYLVTSVMNTNCVELQAVVVVGENFRIVPVRVVVRDFITGLALLHIEDYKFEYVATFATDDEVSSNIGIYTVAEPYNGFVRATRSGLTRRLITTDDGVVLAVEIDILHTGRDNGSGIHIERNNRVIALAATRDKNDVGEMTRGIPSEVVMNFLTLHRVEFQSR